MATIFTHAALPFIATRDRKLAVTGAVIACLPDLDLIGTLFDPRAHRGFTHSLLFAGLAALLAALLTRQTQKLPWLLFFALSHPLLDVLTHGEAGVALLAPFDATRLLSPFRPIAVIPLGVNEAFSRLGALVLLNEVLLVWLPARFVFGSFRKPDLRGRRPVAFVAWLAVCLALGFGLPGFFAPLPRTLEAPKEALDWATQKPVTTWAGLEKLLDKDLGTSKPIWSSTFFPWWYGGEAGRWQEGRAALAWRTLKGRFDPADALERPGDVTLAPTEKYDLAVGDLELKATRQALLATHNGSPRFWFGLCNGVAAASLAEPEPFRTVDVVSPRGDRIRFLPQDVKALLAAAYFWPASVEGPRNSCKYVGLDSGKVCSMNAAAAVLAVLNRLGIERKSFIVDVVPALQSQFYAVSGAKVTVVRPPHDGRVDVELQLTASSTTLGYEPGNQKIDDTHYFRVGLQPVRFTWPATLGLSDAGEIVSGKWTGTPADGPDTMYVVSGGPLTNDAGMLEYNPYLSWPMIKRIAEASVDRDAGAPTIDLR